MAAQTIMRNLEQLTDFLAFACQNHHHSTLSERENLARSLPQTHFEAAAVLMPFDWRNGEAQIWLTKRSLKLRQHSGQIAFPGGKCDASDSNALATALRETHEELGVNSDNWQIIGQLHDCYLPSGFVVSPVVALRRQPLPWQPNPHEVDEVFSMPLSWALNPEHYQARQLHAQQGQLTIYSLPFAGHDIWGATASMLFYLAQIHPHWLALTGKGNTTP